MAAEGIAIFMQVFRPSILPEFDSDTLKENCLASKHSPLTRLPPWAREVRDRLLLW